MRFFRSSVGRKISAGFLAVVLLVAVAGWFSIFMFGKVSEVSGELRDDIIPGAIAMAGMESAAERISHSTQDVLAQRGPTFKEQLLEATQWLEQEGVDHLAHETHVGLEETAAAEGLLAKIRKLNSVALALAETGGQPGSGESVHEKAHGELHEALATLLAQLQVHKATHMAELTEATGQVSQAQATATYVMVLSVLVVLVVSVGVSLFTARSIAGPVSDLKSAVAEVGGGNLDIRIEARTEDEIGELAASVNDMVGSLRESTKASRAQDWLKSGVARVNEVMRGEEDSASLAAKVVSEISTYLDASVGALYLLREEEGEQVLALLGSYAYSKRKNLSSKFRIGEALVGQAALEKKQILLKRLQRLRIR